MRGDEAIDELGEALTGGAARGVEAIDDATGGVATAGGGAMRGDDAIDDGTGGVATGVARGEEDIDKGSSTSTPAEVGATSRSNSSSNGSGAGGCLGSESDDA